MQILDPKHPFFKPLWRRILTVVLPAAWGVVELANNAPGWALIFFAAAAYAAYELLIMYDRRVENTPPANSQSTEADKGDEE